MASHTETEDLPIVKIEHSLLNATLSTMSAADVTVGDADWIRRPGNAAKLKTFIREERAREERETAKNPFEMTVGEQITALRIANEEEGWGITEEQFKLLETSAPTWPKGFDAFRFFRIRWGVGDAGVALTFENHAKRFMRVFGEKARRSDYVRSDKKHLRLLNKTERHGPTMVEWVLTNLQTNRKRVSVEAARFADSLADEGVALAWQFPDRVYAIDYKRLPGWYCAGYELNVLAGGSGEWRSAVSVSLEGSGSVWLDDDWISNGSSGYSVPLVLREVQS